MIWLMKTKGQDEKSLRIFEEKKQKEKSQNREEIVQIIHTIYYLDFMQEKKLYNQLFYAHCQTTITPTKKLNIKG